MIKRSQYGARNAQSEQRALQPAKVLTGGGESRLLLPLIARLTYLAPAVNTARVQELEQSLQEHAAKRLELKDKHAAFLAKDNEWQNQVEALEMERVSALMPVFGLS